VSFKRKSRRRMHAEHAKNTMYLLDDYKLRSMAAFILRLLRVFFLRLLR